MAAKKKSSNEIKLDPNGICATEVDVDAAIDDKGSTAAPPIPLNQILAAMDAKDRDYYINLDDEMKKKFSPFMMLKYAASVVGSPDLEEYYITCTNKWANKHMFNLTSLDTPHQQLQWLMLTTISPGMGTQRHKWLKMKPKPKNVSAPIKKQLAELFPVMKDDDLDVLAAITTKKELNQYIKDHGEK